MGAGGRWSGPMAMEKYLMAAEEDEMLRILLHTKDNKKLQLLQLQRGGGDYDFNILINLFVFCTTIQLQARQTPLELDAILILNK